MGILQDHRTIAATAAAAGCGLLAGFYYYKRFSDDKNYWTSELIRVGKVEQLMVYPVKSCKPIQTDWIDCTELGPKYGENCDRQFMLIDGNADDLFMTARTYPKLVLLDCHVKDRNLTITNPDGESINVDLDKVLEMKKIRTGQYVNLFSIPIGERLQFKTNFRLHKKLKQDGYDCGDEVSNFVGKFLNVLDKRDVRLLYFVDGLNSERNYTTDQSYWLNPVPIIEDKLAFQCIATYMLCTESSVQDVNTRLAESKDSDISVDMRNFRPNISVGNTPPFEEDRWLHVQIGEVEFACYRPCIRCILTTVDPDKGEKNNNLQPLRIFREYRKAPEGKLRELYQDGPMFGTYMILLKEGRIYKGDQVFARYKPSPL